MTFKRYLLDRW